MKKEIFESIKSGNVKKFYKSCEWIKKRKEILKRDNFECQKCKSEGSFSKAECVHHIKHLRKMPSLGLSESNLISLCNICHNKEHPEKFNQETKIKFVNEEHWE